MRIRCLSLMCALVWLAGVSGVAQKSVSRIAGSIDESQLITLAGNTHPAANSLNDRGPVSPSLRLTDLVLVLRRDAAQQAAFDAFIASQYDPASPNFHVWLGPAEVAARFGPSAADVSAVSAWLASKGLTVDQVAPDRMTVRFSGTASQVQGAFHTSLHTFSVDGEPHIANVANPQIPAALGPVVLGVKALHNFLPRPLHHAGPLVRFNSSTGQWRHIDTSGSATQHSLVSAKPELGITIGTGSTAYTVEDVAPYDFATIYDVLPLWQASSPIDGSGETLAIAGTSDINLADVASFRKIFGLPAGTTPKIVVANGVDPGQCTGNGGLCSIDDLTENTLDVEWSGAVATGASIVLVVSGQTSPMTDTIYSSANYVVQNATAKVLSVSYGECELGLGTAGNAAYNNLWQTAATGGISVFVAAGDAGAATCDQGLASSVPYTAQYGLTVSGIASTPYDTAVGGTDLNWGGTPAPYWKGSNNSTNGASAEGYVPEVPWNDTCTNPLLLPVLQEWATALQKAGFSATSPTDAESGCNFVNQWWTTIYNGTSPQVNLAFLINTEGGGGGVSNCTTSDGSTLTSCSGGYSKPAWQSGVSGIPADGRRDLPDVSFFAGNGLLGSAYLVCVSANGACLNTTSPASEPIAQEIGGTSVGTPAMAGVMALINQKMGAPQGSPNAELYSIAAKQSYGQCKAESVTTGATCSFNDIDTGTIAMPCSTGSADCIVSNTGDTIGLLSGFAATVAFDPASGLGSLNVANVVNAWTATVGTTPATVTVTPLKRSVLTDQTLQVTVAVTGSSGTPTGNVTIVGGGYDGGAESLAAGSYTFNIAPGALTPGTYTVTGRYQGDSTYAEASGTASVTVNKSVPTVTVTTNPTSVGANTPVTATITVSGGTGVPVATGTVQLTAGTWYAYCTLAGGTCPVTIPANTLPTGSNTITASYPGDTMYESANGTATETVTALTPTIKAVASPSSFDADTSFTVAVTATGSGAVPTGTLTLGLLDHQGEAFTLDGKLSNGTFSFSVPPDSVDAGQNSVELLYSGDSTYFPSTIDIPISVKAAPTVISITPSATSIYTNAPLTLTGTVSASSGTPSSSVIASMGSYTGFADLAAGQYSLTIPAGTLPVGSDVITVSYLGDRYYAQSKNSVTVTVTQWTQLAPTINITPAATSIGNGQELDVSVSVSGASGNGTGSVTLTSGSWNSGAQAVINGTASIRIPSNTLPVGTDTLTASYSGDPSYLAANASLTITVNSSTFTLSAGARVTITAGQQGFENITVKSSDGYNGTVTLTCAVTSQPTGAVHVPTCSGTTISMIGAGVNSDNVVVSTTAATASLTRPAFPGLARLGGASLALLAFMGMPSRRRFWRNLLGMVILFFALAGLGACGGGGSYSTGSGGGGGGGGGGTSGTTAGTYTFTVTGSGSPAVSPTPTTTFTVTVN